MTNLCLYQGNYQTKPQPVNAGCVVVCMGVVSRNENVEFVEE